MLNAQPIRPLTELEIRMFLQPAPERGLLARSIVTGAVSFVALAALIFGALNIPAYLQIRDTPTLTPIVASAQTLATPSPAATAAAVVATPTPMPLTIPDNTISIPALGISAPITYDSAIDSTTVHNNLEKGVIQIGGTAHPGQAGVAAIFGHSSNYIWDKGQYNTIFAPLEKATAGMQIIIAYNGNEYTYTVTKSYVVKPTDLSVLTDESFTGVRLITCTPVGTALNRLVVDAVQTSPDPSADTAFTPAQFTSALPNAK